MAEQEFMKALDEFYSAGMRLVDAWDDGEGFNADARWPLPDRIKPPLSLDEWLTELVDHFHTAPEAAMDSVAVQDTTTLRRCSNCSHENAEHVTYPGGGERECSVLGCRCKEFSEPVQYADPDPQERKGTLHAESLRADVRDIGESEGPYYDYDQADKLLDTLGLPQYDLSGCREIDLGPDVYGLVDYDGEYRVGLYFIHVDDGREMDEGGVCATFTDFESTKAFVERLRKVHAPQEVTA